MKCWWGLLLAVVMVGAVGSLTGCGAGPELFGPTSLTGSQGGGSAALTAADPSPKLQNFTLRSWGSGPDGTDEAHALGIWLSYNALTGEGWANLYGDTFVVERISSSTQAYPIQPGDWLEGQAVARGFITIRLEGSFVPGNGQVTEAMSRLAGWPLKAGGSQTTDVVSNSSYESKWLFSWHTDARYSSVIGEGGGSSFANCSVNVNSSTLIAAYARAGEIRTVPGNEPESLYGDWYVDVNFEVAITDNGLPVPVPDENDGGSGGAGGRG